jgi:hypothetical protein
MTVPTRPQPAIPDATVAPSEPPSRSRRARAATLRADDRGEGVVSAAIVVLIMAALGALMWVGFRTMWTDIEADTNERISEVGT